MAEVVRRIDYYYAPVPDKPGEAARILSLLHQAGVNLLGFTGFPEGARKAQLDFLPEDPAAFAKAGVNRAIVNIGGIANVTILAGRELRMGFDTGPGNTLLDHWIHRHRGEPFDRDGAWAASGQVDQPLLECLLTHPYFQQQGPRSTGKEAFNLGWLDSQLEKFPDVSLEDVQAAAGHANPGTTKLYDRRGYNPEKSAAFFANY